MNRGQRRDAHVEAASRHLHAEAAILGQALFSDIEPAHQLEARDQCRRDAFALDALFLQLSIDALADPQPAIARFDVDVGGVYLHGILEQRLQQPQDRGIGSRVVSLELIDIQVAVGQLLTDFLGQRCDFVGAAVVLVDEIEQRGLVDERQIEAAAKVPLDLIEREDVGRVRHADQRRRASGLQNDGPETARHRLGQHSQTIAIRRELPQVDVRDLQMIAERRVQCRLRHHAQIDQHTAELAPAAILLGERCRELRIRQQLALEQDIAEANAGRGCLSHGALTFRVACRSTRCWPVQPRAAVPSPRRPG